MDSPAKDARTGGLQLPTTLGVTGSGDNSSPAHSASSGSSPSTDLNDNEGPALTMDGLATLDELYETGELELEGSSSGSELDSDSEGLDADALAPLSEDESAPPRERLLAEMYKSYDYEGNADPSGRPLVTVDAETADEIYNFLVLRGPVVLHAMFRMRENYPAPKLMAALGFPLPLAVAEDPQYTTEDFDFTLQIAMRLAMMRRKRLPAPRTLDEVVAAIEQARAIIVVTGAGISTSLGIPDFRSDDGLYAQLRHLGLADPQEVFDIRLFKEDPSIFYSVARQILPDPSLYAGTPTHQFIKMLADRGKLLRNYTQNIDNIEHHVGLPHELVVQCHGSFGSAHCVTCGYSVPNGEDLFPAIRAGEVPLCPDCAQRKLQHKRRRGANNKSRNNDDDDDDDDEDGGSYGVIKPDITFFGESLPPRFDRLLLDEGDAMKCDLVLCMGTSLKVAPVSEIVKVVRRSVPQIYVSKTPASHVTFEAMFLGSCDDTVELLAQKLQWPLEHTMNRRPLDMPETEFPRGAIVSIDGVFRFNDPEELAMEEQKKEERRASKLQAKQLRQQQAEANAEPSEPVQGPEPPSDSGSEPDSDSGLDAEGAKLESSEAESELEGSELEGSELKGSELKGSELKGSELKVSELKGSEPSVETVDGGVSGAPESVNSPSTVEHVDS